MTVKGLEYWLWGYTQILAGRQLHEIPKYSLCEQWESTATYFEVNKDDQKAIHLSSGDF